MGDEKPQAVGHTIECASCAEQTADGLAYAAGWRWVTMHDGEADWQCAACRRADDDGSRM